MFFLLIYVKPFGIHFHKSRAYIDFLFFTLTTEIKPKTLTKYDPLCQYAIVGGSARPSSNVAGKVRINHVFMYSNQKPLLSDLPYNPMDTARCSSPTFPDVSSMKAVSATLFDGGTSL